MEAIFRLQSPFVDLWRAYRYGAMDNSVSSTTRPAVALYPLGVPCLDSARSQAYHNLGYATFFLPLWDYTDPLADLDDIEFRANKAPLEANSTARQLLTSLSGRNVSAIVLPYDATSLTRAIAIQCRALGLKTICHFPALPSVLGLYGKEKIASFPICDQIVAAASMSGKIQFSDGVMRRCSVFPDDLSDPASLDETCVGQTRAWLGVGASEAIYLLLLPPLQCACSNEDLATAIFGEIESLLARMQPTDHLIVVAKRRKQGFLNNAAVKLLREKYRKSILFYDEISELTRLAELAREIVAPEGLISSNKINRDSVRFFAVGGFAMSDIKEHAKPTHKSESEDSMGCNEDDMVHELPPFDIRKLIEHDSRSGVMPGVPVGVHEDILYRILCRSGPGLDVIAVPDPVNNLPITEGRQKYLLELLNANRRVTGAGALRETNAAELFVQWGAEPSESKERPEVFRSQLARPRLYLEDGFIRSQGLWTDPNEPTLSVVMDTRAIYYNALEPSLLETILNSDFELDEKQLARAKRAISQIVSNRISKYNHAPILSLDFRSPGKKSILIIDQKAGDMSIKYGCANDDSFMSMLQSALDLGDQAEIIIKQHPCAISGGAHEAHFTIESLGDVARQRNVHLIGFDVNPFSLIEAVDEVWVVSSGMGFEALMAGKKVRCFGVPFYSNWGVTHDHVKIERRRRIRSIEEIFYIFYILLTQYVDPRTGRRCEVEDLIDYFSDRAVQRAA
ncbi:hypothetical protein N6G05_02595 [Cupriavidus gilardii]|nr:hypothetical protein [Cupriavidus gilardii]